MGKDNKYPVVSLKAALLVSRRTFHCILALWGASHIPNKVMFLTTDMQGMQYLFAYIPLLFSKLFDRMVNLFVDLVRQILVDLSN